MIFLNFLVILTGIANLALGILVLIRGAKNKVTFSLASCAVLGGIWAVLLYLYHAQVFFSSLVWIKLVYLLVFFFVFSLFYFSLIFPYQHLRSIFFHLFLYWAISIPLIYILFFTKLWIKDVVFKSWGPETILGPVYIFVCLFWGGFGVWILYNLFKKFLILKGINRERVKYIFIGMCFFILIVTIVNGIIPILTGNTKYFRISPLASLFFVGFTAYAIVAKQLFGIKVILADLLVGVIGLILLFQIFTGPIFGVLTIEGKIINSGIFFLFCIFAYYLVKVIHEEEKRREEIQKIAIQERSLRVKTEKLAQESQKLAVAKDQFLLSIQHHLRTPVTLIKGYTEMILEDMYDHEKNPLIKEKLVSIKKAADILHNLMENLLDIQGMKIGKLFLNKEECQLEEIVQEVIEELKPQAEHKGLYLILEKISLPKIKVDKRRIREIIWNLIDNAIKYTKRGGVKIKLITEEDRIKIIVSDTGIGMTKEEIEDFLKGKLFERGEEAKKLYGPGRGIGLAIVNEFVKAHEGKIKVESEGRDKGSVFTIDLPIK